ncbi:hypothetical protein [Cellulomonas marina]|uniref:Putative membrane protein n=1 Tax=Cellulomonas marina TaxID=988821 RepID=A0A1I0XHW3_9CELL|nr:hypothetical protein [Cellulomonas marina]GIG29844.1 hypothetical protein Cma02nite_24440 [Cellulomonas marina]SFB00026.1 putative membrane protein [Cellulomonas marina]
MAQPTSGHVPAHVPAHDAAHVPAHAAAPADRGEGGLVVPARGASAVGVARRDRRGGLLHPERARSSGRATWFTLLGLVLVPLTVGGLLTWALWQPTERLDRVTAAIVNLDTPVELDGQTVPLGRQLASALVTSDGSTDLAASPSATVDDDAVANVSGSDSSRNFTWVLTDEEDAAEGLADGTYATVVTIPSSFSAAATSVGGEASAAEQATIDIATSERSRLVDRAVAQAVTSTAVGLLDQELTASYLENVYVGFSTLNESLGQAAEGAGRLASGAGELGTGAQGVASGSASLADGVGQVASGADDLADGVGQLADGADELAAGLGRIATQTASSAQAAQAAVPGAQQFTQGLDALAAGVTGGDGLASGTRSLAAGASALSTGVGTFLDGIEQAAQGCAAGSDAACQGLVAAVQAQQGSAPVGGQPTLAAGAAGLAQGAAALDAAVNGPGGLAASVPQLAAGGRQLADGVAASATGLGTLSGALQQTATGARSLADGADDAAAGARRLATGAGSAASGADELAEGAGALAGGAGQLSSGATDLAGGLQQATEQVPSYTTEEARSLAEVVADPVAAQGEDGSLFGSTSVPFLVTVALWLGGLATFLVLGAVTRRALPSTRPSVVLALRSFAPAALVGVVQGLALVAVLAGALSLAPGGWVTLAVLCALTGVAFAAVNQGLVAVLGGIGRFVSVLVAVVGLATAVVSTVPGVLDAVFGVLPLAASLRGLQGVVNGSGGVGGAAAVLVVWTLLGLALTTAAVARRRVVPAGRLAQWARAA